MNELGDGDPRISQEDTRPHSRVCIGCGLLIHGTIENFHPCQTCAFPLAACAEIVDNWGYTLIYASEWFGWE